MKITPANRVHRALDHPTLAEPNKTLYAKDVLQELKSRGGAWWARYRGICGEYFSSNASSQCANHI